MAIKAGLLFCGGAEYFVLIGERICDQAEKIIHSNPLQAAGTTRP